MDKAEDMSARLRKNMKALKVEEGQWRWKRHKEARQLDVQKEALNAKKSEVSLAAKIMDRKIMAFNEKGKQIDRTQLALGRTRDKLTAEKKVGALDTHNSNFLFACFPCADTTSFAAVQS